MCSDEWTDTAVDRRTRVEGWMRRRAGLASAGLALLALVMYPLVWLLLLPFRLLGIGVEAVFELLRAVVLLPARVLGGGIGR